MRVGSARIGARAEQQLHGHRAAVVARQVERGTPRSARGALEERTRLDKIGLQPGDMGLQALETQGCSRECMGLELRAARLEQPRERAQRAAARREVQRRQLGATQRVARRAAGQQRVDDSEVVRGRRQV